MISACIVSEQSRIYLGRELLHWGLFLLKFKIGFISVKWWRSASTLASVVTELTLPSPKFCSFLEAKNFGYFHQITVSTFFPLTVSAGSQWEEQKPPRCIKDSAEREDKLTF